MADILVSGLGIACGRGGGCGWLVEVVDWVGEIGGVGLSLGVQFELAASVRGWVLSATETGLADSRTEARLWGVMKCAVSLLCRR